MSGQQNVISPVIFGGCYLKRFTTQIGFNSSPTTVDLELVPGTGNAQDIAFAATGFDTSGLNPGNVSGLTVGSFNYAGLVQSWTRNFNEGGLTYSVKLADPRIIFDAIPVVMGYDVVSTGNNYPNVLNCFGYYGSPSGAGITNNGVIFRNVRDFLATGTTTINLFNKRFNLAFGSGFFDGTGTVNPDGIPPWYTVKSNVMSLSQLLNQVGQDMGFDYYAYIVPTGNYASTGVISTIFIETIKRTNANNPTEIDDFLTNTLASGTRKGYSRGRELRTDATTAVIAGAPFTSWTSYNGDISSGGEVCPYWGRASDGSAVYSEGSILAQRKAIVLLDHITGSGVNDRLGAGAFITPTYNKIEINKVFADNIYPPPSMYITTTTPNVTGYYASETMLRAALYNQESWEAIFYKEASTDAIQLGITSQIFRDSTNFLNTPLEIRRAASLHIQNAADRGDRDPYVNALIGAVYDAFRTVAEECYGKKWLVKSNNGLTFYANNSTWNPRGFSSTNEYPEIQYEPIAAAWNEGGGYPSGFNNHVLLTASHGDAFKDEQGRTKAFVSITGYNTANNPTFPHILDTSIIPPGEYFIEQGNKLCLPIQVEKYEKKPEYFIVTVPYPLQAITPSGGLQSAADQMAYKEFLYAMGYSQSQIDQYNLMKNMGENSKFGLVPARPFIIPSAQDNYGFFIPVQFKTMTFGPWAVSGSRPGGVNLTTNGDLQPSTYGGWSYLNSVGQQTAAKAISTADILDSAEINIAGLPQYNIGTKIGDNANITSISFQYGVDGLTTNYSIKTFILPSIRVSKQLSDKIVYAQNIANYNKKEIVNINKLVHSIGNQINKVSEILGHGTTNNSDKGSANKTQGSGPSFNQIIGTIPTFSNSGVIMV